MPSYRNQWIDLICSANQLNDCYMMTTFNKFNKSTHLMSLISFYTPWRNKLTRGFLIFSEGIERPVSWTGLIILTRLLSIFKNLYKFKFFSHLALKIRTCVTFFFRFVFSQLLVLQCQNGNSQTSPILEITFEIVHFYGKQNILNQ